MKRPSQLVSAPVPDVLKATILDAIRSPEIFARWFRDPVTWAAWFAFLRVLFGLLLDPDDLALFSQCTGRDQPRPGGYTEAWLCCGRRAGKSLILALVAVFLACFRDWSRYLAPGERGVIMIIAVDRKQARVIHRYCRALLTQVRRTARGGRDSIDHGSGNSHDDLSNVALAVLVMVTGEEDVIAMWIKLGGSAAAPAPVAPVASEPPAPDQLFDNQAPPGSARYRQLAQRRNSRMVHTIGPSSPTPITI
jgi:hypothetical protein